MDALQVKLGFPLKKEQREALDFLDKGRNVLAVLPTGFGKSEIMMVFPQLKDIVSIACCKEKQACVIAPKSMIRNAEGKNV